MKSQVATVIGCGLLLVATSSVWARKWTDNTGKYSVEAELVQVRDDEVTLRKRSGSVITVPIARLSEVDRRYLESLKKPESNQSTREGGPEDVTSGAKASGKIHGREFTPDKVQLERGILTLSQGNDFFPDLAVKIFLFLDEGDKPEGKTYRVAAKRSFGARSPHIHLQWKETGKRVPQTEVFTDGYVMKLEFGKVSRGKLPGKINLRLPDTARSRVSGTFAIDLGGATKVPGTAHISGSITVPSRSKGLDIWVGCLGKSPEGTLEGPATGFKLGSSTNSATCLTWKPRNSSLSWDPTTHRLAHQHVNRTPGWYLVYVRGNRRDLPEGGFSHEGYFDWQWVEIKDGANQVTVDLTVDPDNSGTVEVTLSGPTKESSVTYVPLDERGRLPLPEAHRYQFHTSSAKIEGGKAVIRGLRQGSYQVAVGPWQRDTSLPSAKADVVVKRGSTTKVSLTPPSTAAVRRSRTARKKQDPTGVADLEVTKVYLNEGGYLRAQVKNRGTGHAPEHIVAFFIDDKRIANCRCKGIRSGAEFKASALRLEQFPGTHVVRVVADADEVIPELDETNNSREATLP